MCPINLCWWCVVQLNLSRICWRNNGDCRIRYVESSTYVTVLVGWTFINLRHCHRHHNYPPNEHPYTVPGVLLTQMIVCMKSIKGRCCRRTFCREFRDFPAFCPPLFPLIVQLLFSPVNRGCQRSLHFYLQNVNIVRLQFSFLLVLCVFQKRDENQW